MPQLEKVSIDIPREVSEAINEAVASGEFATAGDVVTKAMATLRSSRLIHGYTVDELDALIAEAEESGDPIGAAEAMRQIDEEFEKEFGRKL